MSTSISTMIVEFHLRHFAQKEIAAALNPAVTESPDAFANFIIPALFLIVMALGGLRLAEASRCLYGDSNSSDSVTIGGQSGPQSERTFGSGQLSLGGECGSPRNVVQV
jgi:hypothetical protein